MQKIVFLVLLSLSLCLSKPATNEGVSQAPKAVNQDVKKTEVVPAAAPAVPPTNSHLTNLEPAKNTPQKPSEPITVSNTTEQSVSNDTNKANDNNKTSDKKEETTTANEKQKESQLPPATEKSSGQKPVKNETKPEEKVIPDLTTQNTPMTSKSSITTTEAPKSDEPKPTLQARGFDGPSFIGGIILALGLLAIGFMGFKYYKNQTERNYHTL